MELSIQTVLINVTSLKQSIAFYQDVLDLRLISQREEVAALMVYETDRRQVLLLRELRHSFHAGRRHVGLRMLSFEAGAPNEFDDIERKLVERHALVWRGQTDTYRAVMGVDPDRTQICIAASLTGTPISSDDWKNVDDAVYAIE